MIFHQRAPGRQTVLCVVTLDEANLGLGAVWHGIATSNDVLEGTCLIFISCQWEVSFINMYVSIYIYTVYTYQTNVYIYIYNSIYISNNIHKHA